MKNKKVLIGIAAILLVLVVGVTLAYLMSTATFDNIFDTGTYKVVTTEVFESPSNWAPGEEIPKTITTENEGTIPTAVRVSYTEQWLDENDNDITSQITSGTVIINLDNTNDWIQEGNYYYYKYILDPGDTTSSFIKSVTLNPNLNGVTCTTSQDGLTKTCESNNPAFGATYKLTITKETVQADQYDTVWNTQVEINTCIDFNNATSWAEIINSVRNNNTKCMNIGDTKTVDLGSLGTHTVRIANKSTPSDCSNQSFSQTACGFVVEFADIITTRAMNSDSTGNTNGTGNRGGWEHSEMRTYVNSDIFNVLPAELKSGIINTTVISGHGSLDSENFTTTDKLYLLSTKEVWGKEGTTSTNIINYDTAEEETRQLDYYKNKGVTTDPNSFSEAIKQNSGVNAWWWLRSASSENRKVFFTVINSGYWSIGIFSNNAQGISPAFRIG